MKYLKQNFAGANDFVWWLGKVVSKDDPKKLFRVKVRINGVHPQDKSLVPDDDLPWAHIIQSPFSAGVEGPDSEGIGVTPHGLLEDSNVFGFFLDGMNSQIPVVVGCLTPSQALPQLSLGKQILDKEATSGLEPPSPYGAKFPYNRVYQTEGGHVIEIDDTPGSERVHVYHRKGSYIEIGPDGTTVSKSVSDSYDITVKDNNVFAGGSVKVFVNGNCNLDCFNDVNLSVSGDLSASVNGKIRLKGEDISLEGSTIDLYGNVRTNSIDAKTIVGTSIKAASFVGPHPSGSAPPPQAPQQTNLNSPQDRDLSVFVPQVDDRIFTENDDLSEEEASVFQQRLIDSGQATEEELKPGEVVGEPETPSKTVPPETTVCGITLTGKENIDAVKLTENFTVGSLSSFAEVSRYRVRAQEGLTVGDIVCNLKLLAANCLEPIKKQYPSMIVTSGFRFTGNGAAGSQHFLGQAADIQFKSVNALGDANAIREEYRKIAVWISNNVAFDKILLEYKTTGTGLPWIHISYRNGGLRRETYTFNNNKKFATGFVLIKK